MTPSLLAVSETPLSVEGEGERMSEDNLTPPVTPFSWDPVEREVPVLLLEGGGGRDTLRNFNGLHFSLKTGEIHLEQHGSPSFA